jgi:hypothetical protein
MTTKSNEVSISQEEDALLKAIDEAIITSGLPINKILGCLMSAVAIIIRERPSLPERLFYTEKIQWFIKRAMSSNSNN